MKTDYRKRYDNAIELFEEDKYEEAYKIFSSLAKISSEDDADLIILSKLYQGYMMALGRGIIEDIIQAHQIYINIADHCLLGNNFLCYKMWQNIVKQLNPPNEYISDSNWFSQLTYTTQLT